MAFPVMFHTPHKTTKMQTIKAVHHNRSSSPNLALQSTSVMIAHFSPPLPFHSILSRFTDYEFVQRSGRFFLVSSFSRFGRGRSSIPAPRIKDVVTAWGSWVNSSSDSTESTESYSVLVKFDQSCHILQHSSTANKGCCNAMG